MYSTLVECHYHDFLCLCLWLSLRFWVVLCFGMLFIITMFLWLFLERFFSIQRCGSVQRHAMQFCHHGSIWWCRAGHFRSDGPPPVYKKLVSIIVEYNSLNESSFFEVWWIWSNGKQVGLNRPQVIHTKIYNFSVVVDVVCPLLLVGSDIFFMWFRFSDACCWRTVIYNEII